MAKYLTKFTDQAAYDAGTKQYPNVSLLDDGTVIYMATRPPYSGKALLTYSDDSEYEIACNASSILSKEEVTGRSGYAASSITKAEIGACTESLNNHIFSGCTSLTNIKFNDKINTIPYQCFKGCNSLANITIPSNITTIAEKAFSGCGLTSIVIPSGVTSLGVAIFSDCSGLTSIEFEQGSKVKTITNSFAYNCSNLKVVVIGDEVTSFGGYCFGMCTKLQSITIKATTPPTIERNSFNDSNNCPILVPSESVNAYKTAWSSYASRIQAIPTT